MKVFSKYIEKLTNKINPIKTCYYEEAPKDAILSYCVLSGISITDLSSGYLLYFNLDIWAKDEGDASSEIESICDDLILGLDKQTLNFENFNSHISFENMTMQTDNEFDLIRRRVSFSSRIFKK